MPDSNPDFETVLKVLTGAEVDFIVVGGVCAVLHGAPISTFDLDLVYSRAGHNLARLEKVLQDLAAVYREKPAISPTVSLLDNPGHNLLMTKYGPLDLLGSTIGGQGYEELLEKTEEVNLGGEIRIKILNLPTLIRMKEQLGRDRDRAVLPILRKTLEEHQRDCE
jgi:hypothetical protein